MIDFYSEEDYNGKTGQLGQVKSYDCGYMLDSNVKNEAEEAGFPSVEEYLKTWWNEVSPELPWTWETLGDGYGYHGSCIFSQKEPDGGILRCKEIYGQIMFDVYPPKLNESKTSKNMKKNTIKLNESQLRKVIVESVKKVLKENQIPDFEIYHGIKKYLSDGDVKTLIETQPGLMEHIAQWLMKQGTDDFIDMICHNYIDVRKYTD